jgi:hypothetical protein
MTTSSLRQLALESEPPTRREISIVIWTLYAVLIAMLAGRAVDYLRSSDMESWAPSSQTDSRAYRV